MTVSQRSQGLYVWAMPCVLHLKKVVSCISCMHQRTNLCALQLLGQAHWKQVPMAASCRGQAVACTATERHANRGSLPTVALQLVKAAQWDQAWRLHILK